MSAKRRGRETAPRREKGLIPLIQEDDLPLRPVHQKGPLQPKTKAQADYIGSIRRNQVTFGVGPAGVGKTYVAARLAAQMYLDREVSQILLTRPAVEAGRSIGYLPGELEEKMAPYIASYGAGFRDGLGEGHFHYLMQKGKVQICPLNFMQGLSWDDNVIVLFDEAENATPAEMKMFLTRIGERARVVIDGDPQQKMIPGQSGLIDGIARTRYLAGVGVVEFTRADIVRSGLVRAILDAYDDATIRDDAQPLLPDFLTRDNRRPTPD